MIMLWMPSEPLKTIPDIQLDVDRHWFFFFKFSLFKRKLESWRNGGEDTLLSCLDIHCSCCGLTPAIQQNEWENQRCKIVCGGHSGQERCCAEWSYWVPKTPQIMSLLHLHCFLYHLSSTVVLPSRVFPAVVNPTICNSSHGLQQFKHKSITIATLSPVGLNYWLLYCSELILLLLLNRSKGVLLWEFWNYRYQNFKVIPQKSPPWSLWTR